jgi:transcriptional regulator with XRE-family HTH domain
MLGRRLLGILGLLTPVPPPVSVSRILGENIRIARRKLSLSQEKLAEKADLSRNYIGNVERAEYDITVEALARIAKALNLTVHDLTRGI